MNLQAIQNKQSPDSETPDPTDHEDLISVIAIKKTVAFTLYSLFSLILTAVISHLDLSFLNQYSESTRRLFGNTAFWVSEALLLFLVIKGYLPQTRVDIEETIPFNEKQLAWGVSILSVLPWLWFGIDFERFLIFSNATNTILLFLVVVFFITKSWLSKKIRWEVLTAIVLPVVHFFYHTGN